MSINLGLIGNQNYNCIVGFSGKIINQDDLSMRKSSSTKMLLIHGDQDAVVSPTFLLEAKDFLIRNNIEIETKMIKNCEHHIPIEASSVALNYIKNNFQI
jgi:phospholipase/carboxylesterase